MKRILMRILIMLVMVLMVATSIHAQAGSSSVKQPMFSAFISRFTYSLDDVGTRRQTISLNYDDTAFSSFTFSTTRQVGSVDFTLYKLQQEPLSKYVLPRRVYQYVTFDAEQLDQSLIMYADLHFRIPVSWLSTNNVRPEQIALFYYDPAKGGWQEQQIVSFAKESTHYKFISDLSGGIGNFAIGIIESFELEARTRDSAAVAAAESESAKNTTTPPSHETTSQTAPAETIQEPPQEQQPQVIIQDQGFAGMFSYILVGGIALFLILALVGFYVVQHMQRPKDTLSDDISSIQNNLHNLKKDINHNAHLSHSILSAEDILTKIEHKMSKGESGTVTKTAEELEREVSMLTPKVIERFVQYQRHKGVDDHQIMAMLIDNGFEMEDIRKAL
jgi:PGF-pre-PGF domain-containing protein